MYIDGDRVVVSNQLDLSEVVELTTFIKERLDFISGVDIEEGNLDGFGTSALLALLASLKKTKPDLDIPIFQESKSEKFGNFKWSLS